jgi:hypothetical protein
MARAELELDCSRGHVALLAHARPASLSLGWRAQSEESRRPGRPIGGQAGEAAASVPTIFGLLNGSTVQFREYPKSLCDSPGAAFVEEAGVATHVAASALALSSVIPLQLIGIN